MPNTISEPIPDSPVDLSKAISRRQKDGLRPVLSDEIIESINWDEDLKPLAAASGINRRLFLQPLTDYIKRNLAANFQPQWLKDNWYSGDLAIARELGAEREDIPQLRKLFRLHFDNRLIDPERLKNLDWSLSNIEIGRMLKVGLLKVRKLRKIFDKSGRNAGVMGRRIKHKIDWESVDWELPLETIAKKYKTSTTNVRYHKSRLGITNGREVNQCGVRWNQVDWSKNNQELAQELGVSTYTVGIHRHQFQGAPMEMAS